MWKPVDRFSLQGLETCRLIMRSNHKLKFYLKWVYKLQIKLSTVDPI